MKVLLRDDVAGVGRRGDIVEVSGGYARNFLLPKGSALVATRGIESQSTAMRRARDLREARDRETAEAQARALTGTTLQLRERAGSAGRLFGSVSAADLAKLIAREKGIEVDRRSIALDEPIKALGTYEVPVRLFGDVGTVVTVEVLPSS
jgi:large subunit ribosomal protein L9